MSGIFYNLKNHAHFNTTVQLGSPDYLYARQQLYRSYQLRAMTAIVGLAALLSLGIALIAAYGVTIAFLATPIGIGVAVGVGALIFTLGMVSVIKKCQHQALIQKHKAYLLNSNLKSLTMDSYQFNQTEIAIVNVITSLMMENLMKNNGNWPYKLTANISCSKILAYLGQGYSNFIFSYSDNNFHWTKEENETDMMPMSTPILY